MNSIKRLNRGNFSFSNHGFVILLFVGGMEVGNKYKISAQYLQNYAGLTLGCV